MPVSGLVITLEQGPMPMSDATNALLGAVDGLSLGERQGAKVPAVLEGDTYRAHDHALRSLQCHPAVVFVDVVSHDFSDVLEDAENCDWGSPRRKRS